MSEQKKGGRTEKGGKKLVFTICIAAIIALSFLVAYLLINWNQGKDEEVVNRNVVVNEDNVDQFFDELDAQEAIPPDYYEVTMNSTWKFPSGGEPSVNAYVENAKTNRDPVYFDIELADSGVVVYESPILPVGSHLENIVLDKSLENGIYDCILTYHLLDKDNTEKSALKITVILNIGE